MNVKFWEAPQHEMIFLGGEVVSSFAQAYTQEFYRWERRGRGWQAWDAPVELEPPFEPFRFHTSTLHQTIDDGRRHTLLSALIDRIWNGSSPAQVEESRQDEEDDRAHSDPLPFTDDDALLELCIALPPDEKITMGQVEGLLLALSVCRSPVSFEIIGGNDGITFQIACRERDGANVEGALRGYFPAAVTQQHAGGSFGEIRANYSQVVHFGLSQEFTRPLRTASSLDPDPLIALVSPLEALQRHEIGLVQVLFQATRFPWSESVLRAVSDGSGGCFFADAPEMLPLARDKTASPLFAVVVRVAAISDSDDRTREIVRGLASGLVQFADPHSNELVPLATEEDVNSAQINDVIRRTTRRCGMLLNSRELAMIVHPPSSSVRSIRVRRYFTKTRIAPRSVQDHNHVLGENSHRGAVTRISLDTRQRLNHIHVIGATGTGKSTLLHSLIVQDIEQGNGLTVIDPHGDLIERVIACIPARRTKDVVLFDPSDPRNPIGVNILSARTEAEKNVTASDLVAVFRRMSTSWGDQMTVVLGNAIQAFLENERPGTLLDLRKFLLEKDYRKNVLRTVEDKEVRYFWENEHHLLRGGTTGAILTRLDTFLRPKIVRGVVAPRIELSFQEILNHGKILLVKLAQGLIGEENSSLLGTLIVSKLHQGAMGRQAIQAKERSPFYLYIDEFQNFITPSLAGVLSGTRKYGLGLILAHQDLRQIFNQDSGVANSVISNPGTRICFRVGDFDAQKLQDGFTHFTAQDLQNMGLGEAVARVERSDDDFNLRIDPPRTVHPVTAKARRRRIIELSHVGYPHESIPTEEPSNGMASTMPRRDLPPPSDVIEEPVRKLRSRDAISSTPRAEEAKIGPPATSDRELSQHRYLQTLIKCMAEDRGFRAVIEQLTPDGLGRVDVGLEQNGKKLAVEISATTDEEQEFHNIEKCLSAGYHTIIVCSTDARKLEKIKAFALERLTSNELQNLLYLDPDSLFQYLDDQTTPETVNAGRIKGYRVKTQYETMGLFERNQKRDSIARVVLQSMRKLQDRGA